jgi:hypothetical protein
MTNGDNGMNVFNNVIRESIDIGKDILEYMYQSPSVHTIITLPADVIAEYVGTYIQPNGRLLTITKEDNAIRMSGDGVPTLVLYPETESKFFLKEFDAQLEFVKNEAGKVIKLVTYENGKRGIEAQKR